MSAPSDSERKKLSIPFAAKGFYGNLGPLKPLAALHESFGLGSRASRFCHEDDDDDDEHENDNNNNK